MRPTSPSWAGPPWPSSVAATSSCVRPTTSRGLSGGPAATRSRRSWASCRWSCRSGRGSGTPLRCATTRATSAVHLAPGGWTRAPSAGSDRSRSGPGSRGGLAGRRRDAQLSAHSTRSRTWRQSARRRRGSTKEASPGVWWKASRTSRPRSCSTATGRSAHEDLGGSLLRRTSAKPEPATKLWRQVLRAGVRDTRLL